MIFIRSTEFMAMAKFISLKYVYNHQISEATGVIENAYQIDHAEWF